MKIIKMTTLIHYNILNKYIKISTFEFGVKFLNKFSRLV